MAAYTTEHPAKQSKPKKAGGCHCKEEPEVPCSCCQTICFDRPQYHCGHLLSSEDLTLQLRYDIEKNKLRNRTLFGCGVVCGLRLTCDSGCEGAIRVSKGYALDGCGNDLVVCESTRFNVLARLREKKLIDCPPHRKDPCDEDEKEPRKEHCPDKDCFYIVACYCEEDDVFETPFQAGCDPKPAACVPTRVHERVSFDVVTKPPSCGCSKHHEFQPTAYCLTRLEQGPVGEYMHSKLDIITKGLGGADGDREVYCEVLCNLKKLFRQHVKEYPAEFNCDLLCEVDEVECPKQDSDEYAKKLKAALSTLLNLIHRYSSECATGNLVFDCCEPCEAGCVVLGAVYVEDGKLRRVCNTPREYVRTFANFWKVLHFDMVQTAIAELAQKQYEGREHSCCPEFNFDGELLGRRLAYSRYAMSESVAAFPQAMNAVTRAAALSFSFPDAGNFAPGKLASHFLRGFIVREEGVLEPSRASFIERDLAASFMKHALVREQDNVVAYKLPNSEEQLIVRDVAEAIAAVPEDSGAAKDLSQRLSQREAQIDQLSASLAEVQRRLDALSQNRG